MKIVISLSQIKKTDLIQRENEVDNTNDLKGSRLYGLIHPLLSSPDLITCLHSCSPLAISPSISTRLCHSLCQSFSTLLLTSACFSPLNVVYLFWLRSHCKPAFWTSKNCFHLTSTSSPSSAGIQFCSINSWQPVACGFFSSLALHNRVSWFVNWYLLHDFGFSASFSTAVNNNTNTIKAPQKCHKYQWVEIWCFFVREAQQMHGPE